MDVWRGKAIWRGDQIYNILCRTWHIVKQKQKVVFRPCRRSLLKNKTCFSVDYFFENLSAMPVKSAVVFVDASFNCYNRKGTVLVDDITSGIKSKTRVLDGNVVACFAAQGNETAFQYEDKKHGVFTYFLLKEIQNNPSNLTLGGLFYEVQSKVKTYSLSEFKKLKHLLLFIHRD